MTTEPDLASRDDARTPSKDLADNSSRAWTIGAWVVGAALVTWFFVAWLALGRVPWDAAGESVGSGFVLLLIVTLIGAARRR